MDCRRRSGLPVEVVAAAFIIVFVALTSSVHVDAAGRARLFNEDFAAPGHLQAEAANLPPSVFDRVGISLSNWMEMLPSGPSPKGAGH
ncbi:hypothetical protein DM860_001781 [Cuscuta australis]|uniref:Uncharacterized protein n=1 Tax=Cuscuta australis TaxID=267555 RepID=A0A328EDK3_9ASTE|nr:hypothetical protein DM860_001781 [Cuscuta australis]